jgi:Diguanylate cyclase, GGDEF domain
VANENPPTGHRAGYWSARHAEVAGAHHQSLPERGIAKSYDEDGGLIAVVETLRDMTDQKRARYGGEEFAVLMPDSGHDVALHVGERLRHAVSNLCLNHGAPAAGPLVTLSIGVATQIPMDNMHSDLLAARADQALYAAKHSGRNCVLSAEEALAAFGNMETGPGQTSSKARARRAGNLRPR